MSNPQHATIAEPVRITQKEIEDWMVKYVSNLCDIMLEKVSTTVPLRKYGLDSATAVTLSGDLMDWLKCDIDPSLLYEHPTIEKAAQEIMNLMAGS